MNNFNWRKLNIIFFKCVILEWAQIASKKALVTYLLIYVHFKQYRGYPKRKITNCSLFFSFSSLLEYSWHGDILLQGIDGADGATGLTGVIGARVSASITLCLLRLTTYRNNVYSTFVGAICQLETQAKSKHNSMDQSQMKNEQFLRCLMHASWERISMHHKSKVFLRCKQFCCHCRTSGLYSHVGWMKILTTTNSEVVPEFSFPITLQHLNTSGTLSLPGSWWIPGSSWCRGTKRRTSKLEEMEKRNWSWERWQWARLQENLHRFFFVFAYFLYI